MLNKYYNIYINMYNIQKKNIFVNKNIKYEDMLNVSKLYRSCLNDINFYINNYKNIDNDPKLYSSEATKLCKYLKKIYSDMNNNNNNSGDNYNIKYEDNFIKNLYNYSKYIYENKNIKQANNYIYILCYFITKNNILSKSKELVNLCNNILNRIKSKKDIDFIDNVGLVMSVFEKNMLDDKKKENIIIEDEKIEYEKIEDEKIEDEKIEEIKKETGVKIEDENLKKRIEEEKEFIKKVEKYNYDEEEEKKEEEINNFRNIIIKDKDEENPPPEEEIKNVNINVKYKDEEDKKEEVIKPEQKNIKLNDNEDSDEYQSFNSSDEEMENLNINKQNDFEINTTNLKINDKNIQKNVNESVISNDDNNKTINKYNNMLNYLTDKNKLLNISESIDNSNVNESSMMNYSNVNDKNLNESNIINKSNLIYKNKDKKNDTSVFLDKTIDIDVSKYNLDDNIENDFNLEEEEE